MTAFVHCRGCGVEIHETAPTCPKCGAPQLLATAPVNEGKKPGILDVGAYSQVPWYRRRWFVILGLLTISPIAGLVALTGDVFYDAKGVVKKLPKNFKVSLLIVSLYYFYTLTTPVGSAQQLLCFLVSVIIALVIGLKR